jgi:hypothetical protein
VNLVTRFLCYLRADVPVAEIDPFRQAGADAYELIDEVQPASYGRLAAWNAFLLQVYGDNLVAAGSHSDYVMGEMVVFARNTYQLANTWLQEVRKAQASTSYRFVFNMPYHLPHWPDEYRTDEQLRAMRGTLETGRTRVASDVQRFAGDHTHREILKVRLAQIDSEVQYVERLWSRKPTPDIRHTLGDTLVAALDHVYEIGQLTALPELMLRLD